MFDEKEVCEVCECEDCVCEEIEMNVEDVREMYDSWKNDEEWDVF